MAELGSGDGTGFPTSIDTDSSTESTSTIARADVPNDLAAAIVAIETYLGTKAGTRWPINVKAYGAEGDGSTDDTSAIQSAIDAMSAGDALIVPRGDYLISELVFDPPDDCKLICLGTFQTATDAIAINIGDEVGTSSTVHKRYEIYGLRVERTSRDWTSGVIGVRVVNLQEGYLDIRRIYGFHKGLEFMGDNSLGCSWNTVMLGRLWSNKYGVYINTNNSGNCNECHFFGGRFSCESGLTDYTDNVNIYIKHDASHILNNHAFYSCSLEGSSAYTSVTFTGSGLDDMTVSATTDYDGSDNTRSYKIEIDGAAAPDTFKWSNDGGSSWEATGVSCAATNTLEDGVVIAWNATTGHTAGDYWEFDVTITQAAEISGKYNSLILPRIEGVANVDLTSNSLGCLVFYGRQRTTVDACITDSGTSNHLFGLDKIDLPGEGKFGGEVSGVGFWAGTNNFRGAFKTIADDAVTSFTPGQAKGVIFVYGRHDNYDEWWIQASYKTGTGCFCRKMAGNANFDVATGALAGTTGVDGNMTLSTHTDGKIYIENRIAASASMGYVLLGS